MNCVGPGFNYSNYVLLSTKRAENYTADQIDSLLDRFKNIAS